MRPNPFALTILLLLPASVAFAGNLSLDPGLLEFGHVPVGQPAVRIARIVNHGTPTTISALSSRVPCAEFEASAVLPVTLADGDTLVVTMTYTPNGRGVDVCVLELFDDNGIGDFLGAMGIGTASRLVVADTFISFSDQSWTSATPETLHIAAENQGNEAIQASNFSAQFDEGSEFQLGAMDFPIPAGGLTDIPVIFQPGSVGPKVDHLTLSVNNDLPGDPSPVVQLYGAWNSETGVGDSRRDRDALRVVPSPSTNDVTVHFAVPRAGRVEVEVRDVAGRAVMRRNFEALGSGANAVRLRRGSDWQGTPGVYLVRVALDGEELGRGRLVVTR